MEKHWSYTDDIGEAYELARKAGVLDLVQRERDRDEDYKERFDAALERLEGALEEYAEAADADDSGYEDAPDAADVTATRNDLDEIIAEAEAHYTVQSGMWVREDETAPDPAHVW